MTALLIKALLQTLCPSTAAPIREFRDPQSLLGVTAGNIPQQQQKQLLGKQPKFRQPTMVKLEVGLPPIFVAEIAGQAKAGSGCSLPHFSIIIDLNRAFAPPHGKYDVCIL